MESKDGNRAGPGTGGCQAMANKSYGVEEGCTFTDGKVVTLGPTNEVPELSPLTTSDRNAAVREAVASFPAAEVSPAHRGRYALFVD